MGSRILALQRYEELLCSANGQREALEEQVVQAVERGLELEIGQEGVEALVKARSNRTVAAFPTANDGSALLGDKDSQLKRDREIRDGIGEAVSALKKSPEYPMADLPGLDFTWGDLLVIVPLG